MREILVKSKEFKDSPLGKIPKDWDVKPLSELADVDRGKFTHRPRNDPRFYGGSYPFIQTGDIANSSGGILSTYSQTLNERGITVSREFPVGTIAITIAANIADTAILGIPMFFPDSVVGAVVKKPNSIRYVELCIRRAKQRLDARAPQSAQKNINLEDLRPLLIPVPSPEEQHRIAEVIDTIDSAIAHTSSLIAKLKQMKAGLLHDLLTRGLDENGELRDAIGHPEQFKDSPLGQIPKDWELRKLTDIASYQNGKSFPSSDYGESGIPLLRPGNLPNDNFVLWDKAHTTYLPGKWADIASDYIVLGGELVMNLTAQSLEDQFLGRVCMTPPKTFCLLNQRIARFRAKDCHLPFLFWAIKGTYFRAQIDRIPQGTKVQHIYNSDLEAIILPIPKKQIEQKAIAEILLAQSTRIRTEEAYRDKLKLQKKGLMHDLLTGKVRVKDADKFTPASDTV